MGLGDGQLRNQGRLLRRSDIRVLEPTSWRPSRGSSLAKAWQGVMPPRGAVGSGGWDPPAPDPGFPSQTRPPAPCGGVAGLRHRVVFARNQSFRLCGSHGEEHTSEGPQGPPAGLGLRVGRPAWREDLPSLLLQEGASRRPSGRRGECVPAPRGSHGGAQPCSGGKRPPRRSVDPFQLGGATVCGRGACSWPLVSLSLELKCFSGLNTCGRDTAGNVIYPGTYSRVLYCIVK